MKVKSNKTLYGLTKGKVYRVLAEEPMFVAVQIINDIGRKYWYSSAHFAEVKEEFMAKTLEFTLDGTEFYEYHSGADGRGCSGHTHMVDGCCVSREDYLERMTEELKNMGAYEAIYSLMVKEHFRRN